MIARFLKIKNIEEFMKKGKIVLLLVSLLIFNIISFNYLISASTNVLVYGNYSEIGFIKNNSGSYSINNNSDILIGCVQNCTLFTSRGFSFFDLSSLPDELTLESVYLILNVNYTNASSLNQIIYDVNVSNWTSANNYTKYFDIGSGNNYSSNIT